MYDGTQIYNALEESYNGGSKEKARLQNIIIDRFVSNFMEEMSNLDKLDPDDHHDDGGNDASDGGNDASDSGDAGDDDRGSNGIIMVERSLLTNASIFIEPDVKNGNLESIDGALLKWKSITFHNLLIKTYNLSPLYVYLKADPEECLRRVQSRRRREEKAIKLDFLRTMYENHEKMYKRLKGDNRRTLIINLDDFQSSRNTRRSDEKDVRGIVDAILKMAKSTCV